MCSSRLCNLLTVVILPAEKNGNREFIEEDMMKKLTTALAVILVLLLVFSLSAAGCGDGEEETTPGSNGNGGIDTQLDSDGDGWTDAQEEAAGSDPFKKDTDGDGHWDPLDPNPLDAKIPAEQTQTPVPTGTASPTTAPTPKPTNIWGVERVPDELLSECAGQFLTENSGVSGATIFQSTNYSTLVLNFSIHWETPPAEMQPLAEEYIRVVKSRVDVPPGIEIGPGTYTYVVEVKDLTGQLMIQGIKCASCNTIKWS